MAVKKAAAVAKKPAKTAAKKTVKTTAKTAKPKARTTEKSAPKNKPAPAKKTPAKPTTKAPVKTAAKGKPAVTPKKDLPGTKPAKATVAPQKNHHPVEKNLAEKIAKPPVAATGTSAVKPDAPVKHPQPEITTPSLNARPKAEPVEAPEQETEENESNTSIIADMIAEKKPKTKSAIAEPKERKPSARALKLAEKAAPEPVKERRFNFKLKTFAKEHAEFSTEEKLQALFQLQLIDSEIDRIRIVRGELPMEVNDLEDEIAGLQTRIQNYTEDVDSHQNLINAKKQAIKDSNAAIKKYESQQMNVKNNREFDSLNKEIEFQHLEIQLSEKRIKEYTTELVGKTALLEEATLKLNERLEDLNQKKEELNTIIDETRKEEDQLMNFGQQARQMIDERLAAAYDRIRQNARNGLAVVTIQRDACGGCFNKIPPQRQLDIRQHKKVIVCEHCGRILVDSNIEL